MGGFFSKNSYKIKAEEAEKPLVDLQQAEAVLSLDQSLNITTEQLLAPKTGGDEGLGNKLNSPQFRAIKLSTNQSKEVSERQEAPEHLELSHQNFMNATHSDETIQQRDEAKIMKSIGDVQQQDENPFKKIDRIGGSSVKDLLDAHAQRVEPNSANPIPQGQRPMSGESRQSHGEKSKRSHSNVSKKSRITIKKVLDNRSQSSTQKVLSPEDSRTTKTALVVQPVAINQNPRPSANQPILANVIPNQIFSHQGNRNNFLASQEERQRRLMQDTHELHKGPIDKKNTLQTSPIRLSAFQIGAKLEQMGESPLKSISPSKSPMKADNSSQDAMSLKKAKTTYVRSSIDTQKVSSVNPVDSRYAHYTQYTKEQKDYDKELWKKFQTQNRYSQETVDRFSSLKDIFKTRVQFNHKTARLKEKLERRCKIGHREFEKYKHNFINIQTNQNTTTQTKISSDPREQEVEEVDSSWSMKKFNQMYEESVAVIKDESSFFVHGKFVRFSKNSLGIMDNKTKVRFFLVWLSTHKRFENMIISLILLNSLFLGMKDYTDIDNSTPINQFVESLEPFFTVIFLFECLIKVFAMGFIMGNNSYLSDAWNWLDFIVVVTSLLNELPSMQNMSGLRTFRLFRPLRSLTTMPSMKLLIGTLLSSVSSLGGIMGLAMFFFMIFAILGVSLWDGKIHYRCYLTEWPQPDGTWELLPDYNRICTEDECPNSPEGNKTFCNSRFVAYDEEGFTFGITSNMTEDEKMLILKHDSDIYDLNYGITNFDDIGSAFLTIFQCITMEGWTKIMNIYEDAFSAGFVNLYFIACVVICSFFLLNLTIAVMLMKYEELDKTQANSKHNEELRQIGISINLPVALTEFLIKQDNIQIQSGASNLLRQEDSFIKQLFAKKTLSLDMSKKYYQYKIVQICQSIIKNSNFEATIILVIIMNTMSLALDKYPDFPQSILDSIQVLNFCFTIIFTAEAVFKMIGLGFREFAKETFNLFDLGIVLISLAEMQFSSEDGPGVFSSFRAFRLFKIFRLFRVGDLRILLDSITFTLTTIGDYVLLLLLFIYVFALLGMSFFAGKLKFDDDDRYDAVSGESPRTNFDDISWSVITIFIVLLGEGWNDVMYLCNRSAGGFSAVYFVGLVFTGNIIMLNLFLAILLGNFDKARNFGQKKKVFEAFKEIMADGYSLNESLDIILGDMSIHVKTKILKWDAKEVKKIHAKGDTKIAMGLLEEGAQFMSNHTNTIQNDNMTEKKIALSHIDMLSKDSARGTQNARPGHQHDSKSGDDLQSSNIIAGMKNKHKQADKLKSQIIKNLSQKLDKKQQLLEYEKKLNDKEDQMADKLSKKRAKKQFSRVVENIHKQNPKRLKRMREMNRQYRIFPLKGLKEILERKENLSDVESVKSEDFKKCAVEQQRLRKLQKQQKDENTGEEKKISLEHVDEDDDNVKPSLVFSQAELESARSNRKADKAGGETLQENSVNDANKLSLMNLSNLKFMSKDNTIRSHRQESPTRKHKNGEQSQEDPDNSLNLSRGNSYSRTHSLQPQTRTSKDKLLRESLAGSKRNSKIKLEQKQLRQIKLITNVGKEEFLKGGHQFTDQNFFNKTIDNEDYDEEMAARERAAQRNWFMRIIDYCRRSSLYIFHVESNLRRFCLQMAESPETLAEFEKMEKEGLLDNYVGGSESLQSAAQQTEQQTSKNEMNKLSMNPKKNKPTTIHPSKKFDDIVLLLIICSSILLAVDNPYTDPSSTLFRVTSMIDVVFTCLFTIEAMIKIIAKGLIFNNLGPISPYLSSSWNQIDFFVVMASLIDLIFQVIGVDMQSLQALKALRALRALRPLRVISKNEGMRLVVNALFASIPSMTNVLLVCALFILIFSIMGVNYFKGSFYHCIDNYYDGTVVDLDTINTKDDCLGKGGLWENTPSNFDNTIGAMSTLFQMMTTEGWVNVMYNGIDSVGINKQPKVNYSIMQIFYFVAFMIIGSQFIINLFVGVVIDNFNTIKEKEELGNMFVTEQQRSWIEIQKVGQGKKLRRKINQPTGFQQSFYWLVNHRYFEYTITFFIFLNTIVMAMKKYRMSKDLELFSEYSNYVFSFVFNLEMILKLIGLGKVYFMSSWNTFDMVIVIATDFGLILKIFNLGSSFSSAATVIRGFRIMRMFKLIRSSVHIRLILDTVFNILPQISNILSLILLLFFIYAALGTNLFSGVMLQENLDSKNNFQTFANAMIILMKFSTGEDWNAYMYELANSNGYNGQECLELQTYEIVKENNMEMQGCGNMISFLYFFSFTILVSMLIMNLSVAAVIEGLDTAKKENMGIVQGDEIEQLIDHWQDYDPNATGWITLRDLVFLLYELPPPLGKRSNRFNNDSDVHDQDSKNQGLRQQDRYLVNYEKRIVMKKIDALELLKDLKIKIHSDAIKQVHFVDVFKALMKRIFVDKQIDYKLSPNLNKKIKNQWEKKHKENSKDRSKYTAREEQAGLIITRWARKLVNAQKNTFKKADKRLKKKDEDLKQQNQQDGLSRQQQRQQFLKEQARVIFNIINSTKKTEQDQDEEANALNEHVNQFKVKNSYSWKGTGGGKILANLDNESDTSENAREDSSDPGVDKQILEEKGKQAAQKEKEMVDEFTNQLFGPSALAMLQQSLAKSLKKENHDKIQIDFFNMDNGEKDKDKKQVYVFDNSGVPKRDEEVEQKTVNADKKNEQIYEQEAMGYLPNQWCNAQQTRQYLLKRKMQQQKEKEKLAQEKKEEMMMPEFTRKKEHLEEGVTGSTIVMDDRFFHGEDYHKIQTYTNDAERRGGVSKEALFEDYEENKRLQPMQQARENLVGTDFEHIYYPSKAPPPKQDEEKPMPVQGVASNIRIKPPPLPQVATSMSGLEAARAGNKTVTNAGKKEISLTMNKNRGQTPQNKSMADASGISQAIKANNFVNLKDQPKQ